MSDGLVIRAITDDEVAAHRGCLHDVFAMDPVDDPHGDLRFRTLVDRARTYGAFDGAAMVGTAAAYSFALTVCGGVVPMGALTQVTVRPTHRRRGLLRRMIAAHLDDVAARGEPLSGLWASEGSIYGRFGYGVAAESDELSLVPDDGHPGGPRDVVVQLDEAAAVQALPGVYDRARPARPGMFARSEPWWRLRCFADRADRRRRHGPRRYVVTRRGDELTGYAMFRQQLGFADGRPAGSLEVEELLAIDPIAEATLWHHVTHVDLFPKITYWNAPTDALAPWLALDRRNVVRRRRDDTLWLRLVDVAGALAARRYQNDGTLRLAVIDASRGRWELTVDGGIGRCEATTAPAELELELAALGSIYLGGFAPSLLARAGHIRGSSDALAKADRIFSWPIAPWCAEVF